MRIPEDNTINEGIFVVGDKAACHPSHFDGKYQTILFFSDHIALRQQAVEICMSCEVREVCLRSARSHKEKWGIWGGREFRYGRDYALGQIRRDRKPSPPS